MNHHYKTIEISLDKNSLLNKYILKIQRRHGFMTIEEAAAFVFNQWSDREEKYQSKLKRNLLN